MDNNTQAGSNPQKSKDSANLAIYNAMRSVPKEAIKAITDGRLKGKSDINPMWRIKALTEQFGPCGIGWKIEITRKWMEQGDADTTAAFVDVNLYVKDTATGQWSEPIPGNGGNVFKRKENSGKNYVDDDCFKKALSDAIGTAAKFLGVAADVYWENDVTKYSSQSEQATVRDRTGQETKQTDAKEILSPASPYWNQSVATAMNTSDSIQNIRERIEKKFNISDKDFRLLMQQSGKTPTTAS